MLMKSVTNAAYELAYMYSDLDNHQISVNRHCLIQPNFLLKYDQFFIRIAVLGVLVLSITDLELIGLPVEVCDCNTQSHCVSPLRMQSAEELRKAVFHAILCMTSLAFSPCSMPVFSLITTVYLR